MENYKILTYDDIINISAGTSKEPLIDVRTYDQSIIAKYDKCGMLPYTGEIMLVRRALAKKLARVNNYLKEKYQLKIRVVYGYRQPKIQAQYFQKNRKILASKFNGLNDTELDKLTHNFVAIPEIAGHPVGGAVDLTMVDKNNIVCDMGTEIADYTNPESIKTFAINITESQKKNRKILLDAMLLENFAPFYGEWWHFSYGDREWAAFYDKPSALYGPIDLVPIDKPETVSLITSASGNGTVIQLIDRPWERQEYEKIGKELVSSLEVYGAEQAGFLIASVPRLEMAGGEFCGNASCAAAVILSESTNQSNVNFSVSGLNTIVSSQVNKLSGGAYRVISKFENMGYEVTRGSLLDGESVDIVDLGGIVHVLIRAVFPASADERRRVHEMAIDEFGLSNKDAVGVIWFEQTNQTITINPVVWVRSVNSFCYESSCGSGSIATALITNQSIVQQPTGEAITIKILDNLISIETTIRFVYYAK